MKTSKKLPAKYFPSQDGFDLESFPLYWVARLNAKYSLAMERKLKRVGMDVPRWRVAMLLRLHGELSISHIAEHAIAKLPTITKIVYRMHDEGVVSIKTSEHDGRVSMVSLTEKGAHLIGSVNGATVKLFERVFDGLSEERLTDLVGTLHHMFRNISDE
jgi:DNA-binding MarR family transcriptional regulator